ncbi:hypothetical protein R1flu_015725 [Riccia fluitans]|uniref:isopentenyl-diphosphate Delta-isomerase n=1 Tax=Riccia fluitans TaxID=41844 RepID=A0ABD1YJS5_9MARC
MAIKSLVGTTTSRVTRSLVQRSRSTTSGTAFLSSSSCSLHSPSVPPRLLSSSLTSAAAQISPPHTPSFELKRKLLLPFDRVRGRFLSAKPAMGQGVEGMDPVQQRLMFEDECILVDEEDNVVGHDSKYNCHLMERIEKDNLLHRAFSVFLFNSKNELLLQKRSATKVTFPLVWTNTCCSHPLYRESELIKENHLGVRNAAQRKLFDELGIEAKDAPVADFTPLGRILYKAPSDGKWGEHELDYLLFMKREVDVNPNPEEVADVQYVNKEQLQELVRKAKAGEDGVKLSPWFQLVVENFLGFLRCKSPAVVVPNPAEFIFLPFPLTMQEENFSVPGEVFEMMYQLPLQKVTAVSCH